MFTSNGYTITYSKEELLENKEAHKLLGMFESLDSEYIDGKQTDVQLKDIAKFAVEYLENEHGFFLMIEGAYIDKNSHSHYFHETMCEVRSLIDTIEYLYSYAADGKTAVIITADHENGGLDLMNDNTIDFNALFTASSHTRRQVPLYIKNYAFNSANFGYSAESVPENTVVFEICRKMILGERA